jgi:hypothetical protein
MAEHQLPKLTVRVRFPSSAPLLSQDEIANVLTSLRPARLGLVPASRSADVLPLIGWSGFAPGTDGTLSLQLSCAPGNTGSVPGSWTWDSLRSGSS